MDTEYLYFDSIRQWWSWFLFNFSSNVDVCIHVVWPSCLPVMRARCFLFQFLRQFPWLSDQSDLTIKYCGIYNPEIGRSRPIGCWNSTCVSIGYLKGRSQWPDRSWGRELIWRAIERWVDSLARVWTYPCTARVPAGTRAQWRPCGCFQSEAVTDWQGRLSARLSWTWRGWLRWVKC